MKLLEFKNVSKSYHSLNGETKALENISFTVSEGNFIAIVGPSGCGKSTILSLLTNLESVSSGKIIKYKENLRFGYMFQQDNLFDWLTILNNCLLGPKINKTLNKDVYNKCIELLKIYELYEFKDKYPKELSGGMRQRVALIRTLLLNPDILLLDEPFSALDYQNRLLISNDVYNIIKKENKTTIMVTHDVSEAVSMADIVIILSKRPSKIKKIVEIKLDKSNDVIKNRLDKNYNKYCNLILGELNVIK